MQRIALFLALALVLVACGGASDPTNTSADFAWNATDGLAVALPCAVDAGAELELGQAVRGPESARLDAVTLDGEAIGGVVLEHGADADGAALLVSRFSRGEALEAAVVIGSRIVRTGDGSLVRPARAWLAVDGVEVKRREW